LLNKLGYHVSIRLLSSLPFIGLSALSIRRAASSPWTDAQLATRL